MLIEDYTMNGENCDITTHRFAKEDLIGAVVKSIAKDEIVIELVEKKIKVHIIGEFAYTTLEGGKE